MTNEYDEIISNLRILNSTFLKNIINKPNGRDKFLIFAMAKSDKTLRAINILCEKGYGEDAVILSRSILELYVNTKYILSEGNNDLAKQFFAHDSILTYKMLNDAENNGIKILDDEKVKIKEDYEKINKIYKFGNISWTEKRISDIFDSSDLSDTYKTVYKIMCSISHSNVKSVIHYVGVKNSKIFITNKPSDNLLKEALITSILSYWAILECFDNYHDQKYKKNLDTLFIEIKKLNKEK